EARDVLGNLLETHTYDANGVATSSTGPKDQVSSIQYNYATSSNGDTVTRVTYKNGAIADYTLRPTGGSYRTTRIDGGCSSCGARNTTFVYDDHGRITRRQGADGYITLSIYSDAQLV